MKYLKDGFEAELEENLFIFPVADDSKEKPLEEDEELLRIYPYAISWVTNPARPILLFQNEDKNVSVPIIMSSLGAGIAMAQNSPHLPETNPHSAMQAMVESLGVELQQCIFTEVRGHYQYAILSFEVGDEVKDLHLRADEVVTAALAFKIPFFTTPKFIKTSRVMHSKMEAFQRDPQMQIQLLNRPNSYLM